MFSRIEGKLRERREHTVLIDVGGLSYDVMVPGCVMDKLVAIELGKPVALEVFSYLQIDGNRGTSAYFGFTNAIEREFFEALLSRLERRPADRGARVRAPDGGDRRATSIAATQRVCAACRVSAHQKAHDIIAKLQGKVARFWTDPRRVVRDAAAHAGLCRRGARRALAARVQARRSGAHDKGSDGGQRFASRARRSC